MTKEKGQDLGVRTLINGVSAALIALFIFLAHFAALRWMFAAAVAAIGAVAVWEYDQLVKKKGIAAAAYLSIVAVVLYVGAIFIKTQGPYPHFPAFWELAPAIVLGVALLGCFVYFAVTALPPITHISATFLGIVYIGVPLGLFVRIIYFFTPGGSQDLLFEGSWWIVYLIAVTKSADIGGYFVGSYLGKRKLALKLSPNKTLEGALGGLIVATAISLAICYLAKQYGGVFEPVSYSQALWMGALIGLVGQVGDLAESFLKRDAGVKDSSSLPGVGGVLDMVDSLLFTAPLLYLLISLIYS